MTLRPNPWPVVILLCAAVLLAALSMYGCAADTLNPRPPGDYDVYQGDAAGTAVTPWDVCDGFTPTLCYSGEPERALNLPCRPGIWQCNMVDGYAVVECVGEVLPQPERCSDVDEDCNGLVNDGLKARPFDLVISVDNSGSMCGVMAGVLCALEQFVLTLTGDDYRVAVVSFTEFNPRVQVLVPLGPAQAAYDAIAALECTGNGSEAAFDALWEVAAWSDPLNLNWRTGVGRAHMLFTDEPGRSRVSPLVTEEELHYSPVLTFIWSNDFQDFRDIATTSGGQHYNLTNWCTIMAAQAEEAIGRFCE